MPENLHLTKAPIVEAVLDIRVKVGEGVRVDAFDAFYKQVSEQYPDKKERHKWEGKLEFKKGVSPISSSAEEIDGYIFHSADRKQIVQARMDGFTFSRLKPYETWESFRDEAHRLWQIYKDIASPEITRVALRYINKLEIPFPIKDFNEYLMAAPVVPDGLPQGVSSFLTRVVIHEPDINASAIITQAMEQIVNPEILPLILDIDAFRQTTNGIQEEDAWNLLEQLRHLKNRIFFKSITQKAKELFQ
jgi:uncharacterized protein (TIGR04255 family)